MNGFGTPGMGYLCSSMSSRSSSRGERCLFPLARADLGHVMMLAQLGQVHVELLHPVLVRLQKLRARVGRLGYLAELARGLA